ncbi:hypothetical protein ACQWU4_19560, partial [Chryseobacterium sp. MIQD13]|uniref:hypothetical protein n=1 Tax=Chryseobacterium sp. MIQD13 TaxID=3422310 RepID=UPI003D27F4A1
QDNIGSFFDLLNEASNQSSESGGGGLITNSSNGKDSSTDDDMTFQVPEVVVTAKKGVNISSEDVMNAMTIAFDRVMKSVEKQLKQLEDSNWYSATGKGNWFFGTAGILSGTAGVIQSQNMYSQGVRRGISANYQLTGRNLSQFGKMAMTDATVPISKFGGYAKIAGHFSFGLGVIFDMGGMATGQVSPGKAIINTGFGALGNWGGSIGASLSTVYFGVDNFYPKGWPGLFDDGNMLQGKLDEGFNQAGPYRINVFGAHEPK